MNRDDVNYWLSPKFDHVPPTDEELNYGRPISKSQMARLIGLEIKQILIREGPIPAAVEMRVNQLARMIKDEEPEADDEEADAALNDAYAEGRKDEREALTFKALSDDQIDALWMYRLNIHDGELMPQLRDLVRAAIAKATGEPQ